jgi:hypothetical protein
LPYYLCEFCDQPIKVHKFSKHYEKVHPNKTSKKVDLEHLKRVLNESKDSDPTKGKDPISLFFEIAKRVYSDVEKTDTSTYSFTYDYEVKEFIAQAKPTTQTPYPPIMMHPKWTVKDQKIYEQLLGKYKGTEKEMILRSMINGVPVVIVCKDNYRQYLLERLKEGKTKGDIMLLTVFFFLHEMYHIRGYGERDADTKAANAMLEVFGQRVAIPDYEIERWKQYDEFMKKYKPKKEIQS